MGARSRGSGGRSRRGFHTVSCPGIMPNGMLVADCAQQLLADDHRHLSFYGDVHRSVLGNPKRSEDRVLTGVRSVADSVSVRELVAAGSKGGEQHAICTTPATAIVQIVCKQRSTRVTRGRKLAALGRQLVPRHRDDRRAPVRGEKVDLTAHAASRRRRRRIQCFRSTFRARTRRRRCVELRAPGASSARVAAVTPRPAAAAAAPDPSGTSRTM